MKSENHSTDKSGSAEGTMDTSAMSDQDIAILDDIKEARRNCPVGVTMLPVVRYERKLWSFDERLGQLRNIRNPHDYIDLNDFEMEYFRDMII